VTAVPLTAVLARAAHPATVVVVGDSGRRRMNALAGPEDVLIS
jgi:hypothetical protein